MSDDMDDFIENILNEEDEAAEVTTLADRVFTATPLLSHVRQTAQSRMIGPWALLGSCMARTVAEVPIHVRLPAIIGSEASLNLYVALVDRSGVGKSSAHKTAAHTFVTTGYAREVSHGTGEGLIASFMEKTPKDERDADPRLPPWRVMTTDPNVLMYVDEIGQLSSSESRSGASIDPVLRSMWNGEHVGTNNADPNLRRNLPEHSYRLCLVAGVQPGLAGGLLSKQAKSSGTAQRWVWLPVGDPDAPDDLPARPDPWVWQPPDTVGGVLNVVFPEYVEDEVRAVRRRMLRGDASEQDEVRSHQMLAQMKVAAAIAVMHGSLTVDDLYWNIATAIMTVSDRTRSRVLRILSEQKSEDARAKGRFAMDTELGRKAAEEEHIIRIGGVIARAVAKHHENGCARHEAETPCTKACLTTALKATDRGWQKDATDYALGAAWITEPTHHHYLPGTSRPA